MKSEAGPVVEALADRAGLKIKSAEGVDYVFLSPTPIDYRQGGLSFTGTVGAIQTRKQQITLSLGTPGKIAKGALEATRSMP
jgi:hypothetical protein